MNNLDFDNNFLRYILRNNNMMYLLSTSCYKEVGDFEDCNFFEMLIERNIMKNDHLIESLDNLNLIEKGFLSKKLD